MNALPPPRRTAGLAVIALLSALPLLPGCTAGRPQVAQQLSRTRPATTDGDIAPADPSVRRRQVVGFSLQHRPIAVTEIGDPDSRRRVLVVGCIHGNEPAGITIARALLRSPAPEMALWVVPSLNPDGVAADMRGNAHGVDLNRNFPYRWRHLGAPGTGTYSGPAPRSEPETSAALNLMRKARPTLGIWYHQPLGIVDNSQGPRGLERLYAQATRMPLRRLTDYPGSAIGDENHRYGASAFAVELASGTLSTRQVAAHRRAVMTIARQVPD